MLVAISWFLVLALAVAYSAAVWLLHSLAVWSMSGVGSLAGVSQQLDPQALPAWLALFVPSELIEVFRATSADILPWVESAISALPSMAHWLTPVAWVLWGVGLLALLVGGALLHALIAMVRKRVTP